MLRVVALFGLVLSSLGCFEAELGVEPLHPVADAGFDQRRHLGSAESLTIEVDGRASCDPQGATLAPALFDVVEGPARPAVSALGRLRGLFVVQAPGDYLVALRIATDDTTTETRQSAPDYVLVSVLEGEGEDIVMPPPSTNACGEPLELDP